MSAPSCPSCAAKRTLCCGFAGGGASRNFPTDLYLMLLALAFTGGRSCLSGARISERNIVDDVVVVLEDGGEVFLVGVCFGDGGMLSRNWLVG